MERTAASPICPGCGAGLALVPETHVPVYQCAACGGAWLGSDAAVHVMQGEGDALDAELVAVSKHATGSASSSSANGARACPACGAAMSPLDIAGTRVEFCSAHGTWFDRNEIEHIAAATQKLRGGGNAGPGGNVSAGDMVDLAGSVVVGAAKATVGAIGAVFTFILKSGHPYNCQCNMCLNRRAD